MKGYGRGALLFLLLAASARADDPRHNKLTAEEIAEGWLLLFDGDTVSKWRIEGDHQIVDGILILGGKQKTRAYLPAPVPRGFEMRFQHRTEGTASAGVGWDTRTNAGTFIPGTPIPILEPKADWQDWFLLESSDGRPFQHRLINHPYGANGVFAPMESIWIEVPAGTKVHLRNMRWRQQETGPPLWLFAIPLLVVGLVILFVWRWRKRRLERLVSDSAASGPAT